MSEVTLHFEGRPVAGRIGDSLAACLTAAGERGLQRTAGGAVRGLFCGMGVCQDCLVTVDGVPDLRACMTKVTGPHDITRQPALTPARPRAAAPPDPELPVETPDLAVVGGGAGGLTAASLAAQCGLDVLLIDERPVQGGQYFKQPARPLLARPDAQARAGARLIARARAGGARFLEGAVWGAFAPLELGVSGAGGSVLVRPRRLIVATGAYERAVPLPGWTLPGVMTTGAAQTLLRSYGVLPGKRVLVAGNGPLNLQVALELARAGAQVAVAELAPPPGVGAASAFADMLRGAPGLLMRGVAIVAALRRRGIEVRYGSCLRAVEGVSGGLRAQLAGWGADLGDGPAFEVDAVAMGYGFLPSDEIFRALGVAQQWDPVFRQLRTWRDAACRTSLPEVFGVGDCCGLGGAQAAQAEGVLAALAAAESLGRPPSPALAARGRRARAALLRHQRFQRGLWRLFAAADPSDALATPETLICRCEEVSRATLEAAIDEAAAIGAVKRLTRAGMGRCQGRYCAPHLAAMIAARTGVPVDAGGFFAPRPPIKPVRIADLLRAAAP